MCGRISSSRRIEELAGRYRVGELLDERPRPFFNIPPSTEIPVIIPGPKIVFKKWGLTPKGIINLRSDTMARGSFKGLLQSSRCIVPADGFYEWRSAGKAKLPFRFEMKDQSIFSLAAIYAENGFSLFTTEPNGVVRKVHDRMPVVLERQEEDIWLDLRAKDHASLVKMLDAFPEDGMRGFAVSQALNSPKNDDPRLIVEVAE